MAATPKRREIASSAFSAHFYGAQSPTTATYRRLCSAPLFAEMNRDWCGDDSGSLRVTIEGKPKKTNRKGAGAIRAAVETIRNGADDPRRAAETIRERWGGDPGRSAETIRERWVSDPGRSAERFEYGRDPGRSAETIRERCEAIGKAAAPGPARHTELRRPRLCQVRVAGVPAARLVAQIFKDLARGN